jgi:hypothetical protein
VEGVEEDDENQDSFAGKEGKDCDERHFYSEGGRKIDCKYRYKHVEKLRSTGGCK